MRDKGATFWTVIRIIRRGQDIPSIIWGNQKWKGAAPNFNNSAETIRIEETSAENNINEPLIIMKEDPKAWIKKYFKAASEEYRLFIVKIKGIKDIRLSSNPTQAINHDGAEMAIIAPIKRVVMNITFDKDKKI